MFQAWCLDYPKNGEVYISVRYDTDTDMGYGSDSLFYTQTRQQKGEDGGRCLASLTFVWQERERERVGEDGESGKTMIFRGVK